jgi:hypothetical protein
MKIIMKAGFEITEEIQNIARGYDFHTCYIENYGQMKEAEEKNRIIMDKLFYDLGVEKLEN